MIGLGFRVQVSKRVRASSTTYSLTSTNAGTRTVYNGHREGSGFSLGLVWV